VPSNCKLKVLEVTLVPDVIAPLVIVAFIVQLALLPAVRDPVIGTGADVSDPRLLLKDNVGDVQVKARSTSELFTVPPVKVTAAGTARLRDNVDEVVFLISNVSLTPVVSPGVTLKANPGIELP